MATERKSLLSKYHNMLRKKLEGQHGNFVYRGQKYAKWKLQSGAVSRIDDKPILPETLVEYHNTLLEAVRLRGWNRDFSGRKLEDLELLAKLQHHGAATCLLDFTTRFDIALWFACQEVSKQEVEEKEKEKGKGKNESKNGRIFIVAINQYTQSGLGKVSSKKLKKSIDHFLHPTLKKPKKDGSPRKLRIRENKIRFWYWEPETLMGRMLSQESRFFFGPQDIPEDAYFYIDIKGDHKKDLLIELERQQGLRPETVFSDIHGFADINARGRPWKIKSYEEYMQSGMSKLHERGEFASAIEDFDRAIKLKPDNSDAWFYSGVARKRMGMHEKAIENFDEAIRLNADYVSAWSNRGWVKIELERYEDAIADYDEAIKLDASLPFAWSDRGWAKMELKRYGDAIADFDEAIRLDADFAVAWYRRGKARIELGYRKEGRLDMEKALNLSQKKRNLVWQKRIEKELNELQKKEYGSSDLE